MEGTSNLALEDVTNEGLLLMTQNEDNINNDTQWSPDSGASNHMCGHEYLFKEMQKIEDGKGQRLMYNIFLAKGWFNGVNPRCLLRTRPQDQHIEYGATHKERLLDILKRPPATPEGQAC